MWEFVMNSYAANSTIAHRSKADVGVCLASRAAAIGALLFLATSPLRADTYPTKSIRIVTAEAGGSADSAARPLAHYLSTALNVPVVVENRAGQVVSGEIVARASPDGYTLL